MLQESQPLRIAVLGASGSIGAQTLDVVRQHADKCCITALAVNTSTASLVSAAREFGARHVAVGDVSHRDDPILTELPKDCDVAFGAAAVRALVEQPDVDLVLNALMGAAGLEASYATLRAGKKLALANKESLVVGGDLIMPLATHDTLFPVDSEHSAIYQCYLGEDPREAHRIWLTASGGPFLGRTRDDLASVMVDEALAHPTWKMGPKITIDSATLMNKGLEAIEAHHLFNVDLDFIKIVVQPQSCIHSMVEYADGSVIAHLGVTDMRIPIQFALSYPHRWETPCPRIDFAAINHLDFSNPDPTVFRCLALALEAGRTGGTMPCVMSAADEVAVAAFLERRCGFTVIDQVVERVMAAHDSQVVESIAQLEDIDTWAREEARNVLSTVS